MIEATTALKKGQNLSTDTERKATAAKLGKRLSDREEAYLKAIRSGDQEKIATTEIEYRRAIRIFEGFRQTMGNSFQIMMQAIRSLRVG